MVCGSLKQEDPVASELVETGVQLNVDRLVHTSTTMTRLVGPLRAKPNWLGGPQGLDPEFTLTVTFGGFETKSQ